ncbi:monovalent cation/H(+) antiporter subunit G [Devosia ginsengisoli]|uniref:monovalent cation/H(+) antiporter subunit G n=1 Tax=Devosia ginsengisoli TaxID=400770 RepID=UPI0026F2274E|nr:monovalent cation/H(+) antiporter subunit G [Devosia ginsengisoli]MCR6673365.1 monovalent cation/H(+) antiporter subunit G [Devosia ginsengisoli]
MIAAIAIYAGCILLLLGALFSLIAAIGVVRLPDLYTRMHAASKAGAVGGGLVLLAVALLCFDVGVGLRAIIGFVFLLLTTPVSAHLLARASYRTTDQLQMKMVVDELKTKGGPNSAA